MAAVGPEGFKQIAEALQITRGELHYLRESISKDEYIKLWKSQSEVTALLLNQIAKKLGAEEC